MAGQNMASSQELTNEINDQVLNEVGTATAAQKRQKSRHRASVACASCRDRRIRVRINIETIDLAPILTQRPIVCSACRRLGMHTV